MKIILTHTNADFDGIAAMLGVYKLNPQALPVLPRQLNHNVREFLHLYRNGLPHIDIDEFEQRRKSQPVEQIILVDTQSLPDIDLPDVPILAIDHHPQRDDLPENVTYQGDTTGSATTPLVERIQAENVLLSTLEATLLALGIYEDTGSLTYHGTTPRDARAIAWLMEQQIALETIRRFLSSPLNPQQQALFEKLTHNADIREIHGYTVIVSTAQMDHYVEQVNSVAHRLRDLLDPEVLFLLVQMSDTIQLVCRADGNVLDVGAVARVFGGGGHTNAAAAHLEDITLSEFASRLWDEITTRIQPLTMVADLMSYGVQTVNADDRMRDIIQQVRRIGHEGYPVLDDSQVVGLLTRRDADRAMEHGLDGVRVREVMDSGAVSLKPDDSVSTLEQLMVDSGWGQIPVVDDRGKLTGIITRTDLIKHWAQSHPKRAATYQRVEKSEIEQVLGRSIARLIGIIGEHAEKHETSMYMVGGVVRDLLLQRPNYDVDFVVEGNAIQLAKHLYEHYGGDISSYAPFGTAKWKLDDAVYDALDLAGDDLPEHIDFATSRNEFYKHPTALPTVYSGSIKLDLHRRDFTINTLAIQLSPTQMMGRILDFYNGLNDLHSQKIRVLHSLSFIDDPTRILRAVRFEQRLGFTIEQRTGELIDTALPMLQRITGERLRNELTLLLKENQPERGFAELTRRGILQAIHPAFEISNNLGDYLNRIKHDESYIVEIDDITDLKWHLVLIAVDLDELPVLCERLLFSKGLSESFVASNRLIHEPGLLSDPDATPSAITAYLHGTSAMALQTVWLISDSATTRKNIEQYIQTWRDLKPYTDGHTLRQLGLPPGPRYKHILTRLRNAWLDGEITTKDAEIHLRDQLIKEERDDHI